MSKPQPLENSRALREQINKFFDQTTHVNAYNKAEYERLMQSANELQRQNVVKGCLLRSLLFSATGQLDEAERMLRNADANHGKDEARFDWVAHYVNHGFATKALGFLDEMFANRLDHTFAELAQGAVAAGAFAKIVKLVDASYKNSEVLIMTNVLELAKRAASALEQLHLSDEQLASMLDVAGEKLRANELLWQGHSPDIHVLLSEDGGPTLMFDYRVFISPTEASTMCWNLAEELVSRNLDFSGVHIGFIGTKISERLAA
jgi:hypothetical protein